MPATQQFVVINAPIDAVWARVGDFHDMSWAANTITSLEKIGALAGDQIGAGRILNGVFCETLTEYKPDSYLLRYSIDDGPSPVSKTDVSDYVGSLRLSPFEDGRTRVDWSSAWGSDSDAAVGFCSSIYTTLLDELKASFER